MRASPYRTTIARQTRKTTITTTLRSSAAVGMNVIAEELVNSYVVGANNSVKLSNVARITRITPANISLLNWALPKGEFPPENFDKKRARRRVVAQVDSEPMTEIAHPAIWPSPTPTVAGTTSEKAPRTITSSPRITNNAVAPIRAADFARRNSLAMRSGMIKFLS